METMELESFGVSEVLPKEASDLNGGFFPVVIFGIYLSAKAVGAIIITAGVAGAGVGAYLASQE